MTLVPLTPLLLLFAATSIPWAQDPGKAGPAWSVLVPEKVESVGGAAFEILEDHSILVTDAVVEKDTHRFEFVTELKGITGFKLEVLPHASLPAKGPGLAKNGNFVLCELTVAAGPKHVKKGKPTEFRSMMANYSQGGWPLSAVCDHNKASGWAILPRGGKESLALFELEKPIRHPTATRIVFELDYQYGQKHTIGHLRFSATTDSGPFRVERMADQARWLEIQPKINLAIDTGCEFLLTLQELDGSWRAHSERFPTGCTALMLYTLLKGGVRKDHPALQRAAAFLRAHPPRRTYSSACQILALCALGDPQDQERLQQITDELASWQKRKGGFGYPDGAIDLSNTQYGALGLRMAALNGYRLDAEVWTLLADRTMLHQAENRSAYAAEGFRYRPDSASTASMTSAGVAILAICEEQTPGRHSKWINAQKKGVAWLGRHFSPNSNTVEGGNPANNWLYYYLYGIERVGGLLGLKEIGPHDWYQEGARFLVGNQDKEGSWGPNKQSDSCFAILFLAKATSATTGGLAVRKKLYGSDEGEAEVKIRASGDSPISMWVSSFSNGALAECAWDGEGDKGLRVEKVEYMTFGERPDEEEPIVIASIEGDPSRPAERNRFPARHSYLRSGKYWIFAEVTVVLPGEAGDEVMREVLESEALAVNVTEVPDPELLTYAGDATRNLLGGGRGAKARASSFINNSWKPEFALDNLQARGWISKDNDPKPSLTIDLARPQRANILLLTTSRAEKERKTRITKVLVTINGKDSAEVTMDPDPERKTRWVMPKAVPVRTIDLKVLEVAVDGDEKKSGVGFAEVELQYNRSLKAPSKKPTTKSP